MDYLLKDDPDFLRLLAGQPFIPSHQASELRRIAGELERALADGTLRASDEGE